MQVLGDLIKLAPGPELPLPWWHRAPLGLMDGTTVHVALTDPAERPCGDLLVSVIDCDLWDTVVRLDARAPDQAGVLAAAFGAIRPLNIALAEAVTVFPGASDSRGGREHAVTIFCERPEGVAGEVTQKAVDAILGPLGFHKLVVTQPSFPDVVWSAIAGVEHGWVIGKPGPVQWREAIAAHCPKHDLCDLTRAVVSADTKQRLLRFVFPLAGSTNLSIAHRDRPGVLEQLTRLFQAEGNILSALLRRGGQMSGNALLDVVIEPLQSGDTTMLQRLLKIVDEFSRAHPTLRIESKPTSGRKCDYSLLYPTHPDNVIARPPKHLVHVIASHRKEYGKNKRIPVFVSRRFFRGDPVIESVKNAVHGALFDYGCQPVEAAITPHDTPRSIEDVDATMWACSAGIMVVARPQNHKKNDELIGMNLAQEFGFLRGQGKPVLALVQDGCSEALHKWTNTMGIKSSRFASAGQAFDKTQESSIHKLIGQWLKTWSDGDGRAADGGL